MRYLEWLACIPVDKYPVSLNNITHLQFNVVKRRQPCFFNKHFHSQCTLAVSANQPRIHIHTGMSAAAVSTCSEPGQAG